MTAALAIRLDMAVARVAAAIAADDAQALAVATDALRDVAQEAGRVPHPDAALRRAVHAALARVAEHGAALAAQLDAMRPETHRGRHLRAAYRSAP